MKELFGAPVSGGIALGPVLILRSDIPHPGPGALQPKEVRQALDKYARIKAALREDLLQVATRMDDDSPRKGALQKQVQDVVDNEGFDELIRTEIEGRLVPPDRAVYQIGTQYIERLQNSRDALLRERAADLQEVVNRFLGLYAGVYVADLAALPGPRVVVARELTARDLATFDVENTLALVTELGSSSSHAAIIARDHGIPALMGVRRALDYLMEGELVLVDATSGCVRTKPDAQTMSWYAEEKRRVDQRREGQARFAAKNAQTADGVRIYIGLNIGAGGKEEKAVMGLVDNVGMLRTEYLFMAASAPPSEEVQYEYYRRVLTRYAGKTVTLRTVDLGGDKQPVWLPAFRDDGAKQEKRGLRLTLDNPAILKTQLRASLRASAHGRLRIMFPMVIGLDDYRQALEMVELVKLELAAENEPFDSAVPTGPMIEVPGAALLADAFAEEADFAAIGTNDLSQYLLAADRMNPDLELYYQPFHPVVFRLVADVCASFVKAEKPLSVCGELAGDLRAAPVLVGLGVRELSISPIALGPLKRRLNAQSLLGMEQLACEILQMSRTQDILNRLEEERHNVGL